jgi:ubiquinone biosynthesis monooxygenase Coq6
MNDGYASMVWSTKPAIAKALKNVSPSDFCHLVNAAYRMSNVDLKYLYKQIDSTTFESKCNIQEEYLWRESVAKKSLNDQEVFDREYSLPPQVIDVQDKSRASFPFKLRNSESYVDDRVALVGDAAHATHPLAGQGMNQGLLDVECLSQLLEKGTIEGQDIGSIHLLRQYASERYLRNIMMISTCDKLHRLFGTDAAPITWIRSIGLNAVNNIHFAKLKKKKKKKKKKAIYEL